MLEITDQLRRHAAWVESRLDPVPLPAGSQPVDSPPAGSQPAGSHPGGPRPERTPSHPDLVIDLAAACVGQPETGRARRRGLATGGRGTWLAVAAVALVALLVATVALVSARGSRGPKIVPVAPVVVTGPDSAEVPGWAPAGLSLWQLQVARPVGGRTTVGAVDGGPTTTQLFGLDGRPRVEVQIQAVPTGTTYDQGGIAQTVHGRAGYLDMAADHTTEVSNDASTIEARDPDAQDQLTWRERGTLVTVTFADLTSRQAIDFVDSLTWRSANPDDGFAAPASSRLTQLVAPTTHRYAGAGLETISTYLVGPLSETTVRVVACPEGIGLCPALGRDGYTGTWLAGTRQPDGSVVAVGHGSDTVESTAPAFVQAWPDGGGVSIQVQGGPISPADLGRIAASVASASSTDLDALDRAIAGRVQSLPLVASADVGDGHVEVHGQGILTGLCFTTPQSPISCPGLGTSGPLTVTGALEGGALVEGHWVAAAVGIGTVPLQFAPTSPVGGLASPGVPLASSDTAVTIAGTTYQLGLIHVPDAVSEMTLSQRSTSTPGGMDVGVLRPDR